MRRFAGTVALVIPFLAAIACGGRVGLVGNGSCPSPSAVASGAACTSAGQTCTASFTLCGSPTSEDCTCTGGSWSCPAFNGPGCVEACPPINGVQPGSSCDLATQGDCDVGITSPGCDGSGVTGECSCQADGQGSAVWACVQAIEPECPDAQPPGCPDASSVVQGNECDVSPQLSCTSDSPEYDCNGNFIGDASCQCFNGAWNCVMSEPACPACPDPQSVEQGLSCVSPGMQCPGNPTYCDGAVFYDAFECDAGAWNDVATTGCSGSSSSGGGSGSSGGGAVDAGPPDAKGI
ncbi:MAG TPA: hypothetical protein VIJ22_14420 [Polyangiaceae bacterium]